MDGWNNYPEELSLAYELNELMFRFKSISHREDDEVHYSWRLVGLNDEWSPWSQEEFAVLSDIPWGTFTFELRSKNLNQTVSETLSYTFEIRKAYWHTWVFKISLIVGGLLLLFQIYRWRKKSFSNPLD